jgi:hypothetical protein
MERLLYSISAIQSITIFHALPIKKGNINKFIQYIVERPPK